MQFFYVALIYTHALTHNSARKHSRVDEFEVKILNVSAGADLISVKPRAIPF